MIPQEHLREEKQRPRGSKWRPGVGWNRGTTFKKRDSRENMENRIGPGRGMIRDESPLKVKSRATSDRARQRENVHFRKGLGKLGGTTSQSGDRNEKIVSAGDQRGKT